MYHPLWVERTHFTHAIADIQTSPTCTGTTSEGPPLQDLLSSAVVHLSALFPTFTHYCLQAVVSVPRLSEDGIIELTHLVCPMLDFVANIARSGKAKDWFEVENFASLISTVFSWVQMTSKDVRRWSV